MKFTLKGFEINGKNIEGVNLDFKLDEVNVEMTVEEMVQNGKDVMNIVTTFREMINDQEVRNDQSRKMANEINQLREKIVYFEMISRGLIEMLKSSIRKIPNLTKSSANSTSKIRD